jgi:hypothetical protein
MTTPRTETAQGHHQSRHLAALITKWMRVLGMSFPALSALTRAASKRTRAPVAGISVGQLADFRSQNPLPTRTRVPNADSLWLLCEAFANADQPVGAIESGEFPATIQDIREALIEAWAKDRNDPVVTYLTKELHFSRLAARTLAS